MNKTIITSFLGPLTIEWSDRGLERVDIRLSEEDSLSLEKETHPEWLQNFLQELELYLEQGKAFQTWPKINESHWTDFQRQIYQTLFRTPPGKTLTYGEVAAACDRPLAARSVGAAMSRNRLPILIPCHRVVPASGKRGAYSGGEGPLSKQKLLNFERSFLQEASSFFSSSRET